MVMKISGLFNTTPMAVIVGLFRIILMSRSVWHCLLYSLRWWMPLLSYHVLVKLLGENS